VLSNARTLHYEATSRGADAIDGRGLIHKHVTSHVGKFERTALCLSYMQAGQPRTQMASCFVKPKHKHKGLRPACLALAGLVLLTSAGDDAVAASGRSRRLAQSVESRSGGDPIMAIVSLRDQRITVYDADGWILRATVPTGRKGPTTPAGIFSVLQKRTEQYSNLCLAWSGIALHGGRLPGYPLSHRCVRTPFASTAHLFDATRLGLRVIVAPRDLAPVEIAHPTLLPSKSEASALSAARAADAVETANKAYQARLAAVTASREAAQLMMPVRVAESLTRRAQRQLVAAEATLAFAVSAEAKAQAEEAKTKASDRIVELQAQWAAAKAEVQPKLDAVASARAAAAAAEARRIAAAQAAQEAARDLEPMSMFISRKTRRLYVRHAFAPIWESPVTILDADRPVGTHVFTAMERTNGDSGMRWNVVTLDDGRPRPAVIKPQDPPRGRVGQAIEPISTEPDSAKTALDRIVIPQDALDRIARMVSPRSSLIISDEELTAETGNDTEFVAVLSAEPRDSIKSRRRGSGI
jgi:L,D-transpeptidase-like protein